MMTALAHLMITKMSLLQGAADVLNFFASIQSIAGCIWYAWILLAFHYYVHVSMYAERISGSYWIL